MTLVFPASQPPCVALDPQTQKSSTLKEENYLCPSSKTWTLNPEPLTLNAEP